MQVRAFERYIPLKTLLQQGIIIASILWWLSLKIQKNYLKA